MTLSWFGRLGLYVGAAIAFSAPASAVSLSGAFTTDDSVFTTTFSLSGPFDEVATIRSLGYAGGVNLAGQAIAPGGFDPIVSLFDAGGTLVGVSDDGIGVPIDALTGQGGDSLLSLRLAPGLYRIVLSEYDNFPNGNLDTGFSRTGQGNFTAGVAGCTATRFCDPYGFARAGNWALDVSVSAVPEPSSVLLLAIGGLALTARSRRARRSQRAVAATQAA